MRRKSCGFAIALMIFASSQLHAHADCKVERYAELPVTMSGERALIAGSINGVDELFIADSGAFFSVLTRETVDKLKLNLTALPPHMLVRGIGGAADAKMTTVKEFSVAGLGTHAFRNVDFIVAGNAFAGEAAGVIGQNVIGHADTEYDLGYGFIRLFRTKDCSGRSLAYWQQTGEVAVLDTEYTTEWSPHVIATAKLNGTKIRVVFDTGAARSMLTLRAAARAGIRRDDANVVAGGLWSGVGRHSIESWLARFDTLDFGGEQVKNARLRIGDIELPESADMLLGIDFFLSHRIFVAASQHRIYFTYNGGHVFDLSVRNATQQATPTATDVPASAPDTQLPSPVPTDAAGFRQRGAAFAGRREFRRAIDDFDQAIKLDPADPANYYQRGVARWGDHQPVLAMSDFDKTLTLKPDDVPALIERGSLRLANKDDAGARADFDAIATFAPNDASLSLRIARVYESTDHFEEAVDRFDRWIAAYPKDDRLTQALNGRCWSRAVMNKGLELALADCNAALWNGARNSQFLDSRALVWLRLGKLDKSMADYKASLDLQPKGAWSLYGLGIVEVRQGKKERGDKDMQAAIGLMPAIAEQFKRMGLEP